MAKVTKYRADYYYKQSGTSGRGGRTQISGSVMQHLQGASTESAVLNYLRKKHAGCEIELMRLDWS